MLKLRTIVFFCVKILPKNLTKLLLVFTVEVRCQFCQKIIHSTSFTIQSLVDSFRMLKRFNVASRYKVKKGTVPIHGKELCYGAGYGFTLVSGSRFVIQCSSVADPDPLLFELWIRDGKKSGFGIQDPG
jgi:hypothetical protein